MKKMQIASVVLLMAGVVLGLAACADAATTVAGDVATTVSTDVAANTVERICGSGGSLSASLGQAVGASLAGRGSKAVGSTVSVRIDNPLGGSLTVAGTSTLTPTGDSLITWDGQNCTMAYTLAMDLTETFNDYAYVAQDQTPYTVGGTMAYTVSLPVVLNVTYAFESLLSFSYSYTIDIQGTGTQTGTLRVTDGTNGNESDAVVDLGTTHDIGGTMVYDTAESLVNAAVTYNLDLGISGTVNDNVVNKQTSKSFDYDVDFSLPF